jgi:hypothetical protein
LYRGANLPQNYIDELFEKKGQMIKFTEILSTSQNKDIAENFAANAIFEITVKKY